MKRIDIILSLIIGEVSAWLILAVKSNLELDFFFLRIQYLAILLPILAFIGLYFTYFLSKIKAIFFQLGKFVLTGVLNTLIDFGILNFLISLSGATEGGLYSMFKGLSFLVAVTNSYFWNKFWVFESKKYTSRAEYLQFIVVSAIGFGVNVGIASLVVNLIGPLGGASPKLWANVGAIGGTLVGLTWNFLGYKFIVFKAKESGITNQES